MESLLASRKQVYVEKVMAKRKLFQCIKEVIYKKERSFFTWLPLETSLNVIQSIVNIVKNYDFFLPFEPGAPYFSFHFLFVKSTGSLEIK